jgi:hypothetical protein
MDDESSKAADYLRNRLVIDFRTFCGDRHGGKERHFTTFNPYPFSTRLIAAANS